MTTWKRCLVGLVLFFHCLEAGIIETSQMKQLLPYVDQSTLVIFDLDNTVIESDHSIGGDQWFCYYIEHLKKQGLDAHVACRQALSLWSDIQQSIPLRLVESETASIIQRLQKDGHAVIALTTRGERVMSATTRRLRELGVDMLATAPSKDMCLLTHEGEETIYADGILFTNASHKGKALWAFLDRFEFYPKKILFVNDKLSHLLPVQEIADQKGVPFIGLRYGGADARVKGFRSEIADIQLEFYGKILSDEAAEAIYQSRQSKSNK